MRTIPPEESAIMVDFENGVKRVILHHRSGGAKRFFLAAFLVFWLGGWALGGIFVARQLAVSERSFHDLVQLFWIGGWTVAGFFILLILYRFLRPSIPETLILSKPDMMYDSGIAPLKFPFRMKTKNEIREKLMPIRIRTKLNATHLSTLRLDAFDSGKRLSIDTGNKRIEIGTLVNEPEREWVYNLINTNYNC
jgi:hypothetical protein